jgi:hypothetical protein
VLLFANVTDNKEGCLIKICFQASFGERDTLGYTCHNSVIGLQLKPVPELLMLVSVGAEHFSLALFLLENITPECL